MLCFYYGSDSFRIKEATQKKVASFVSENKNGVVTKLEFEKENCREEVENILNRRSFFDDPELILIYANLPEKDLQKKNKKFFEFLSKTSQETKEFESLKSASLEKWALEKIASAGFSVTLSILKKLISYNFSQERLDQEIAKLVAYQSFRDKKIIDNQAIELLVKPEEVINNFALIDAIGFRDVKKAITFLNETLEDGTEPHLVLGQIIYQFRNLLKVKSLSVADLGKAGLHPFVARKTSQQARQFELEELKKIYQRLGELDIKSKTGQIDLRPALFEFVLTIQ